MPTALEIARRNFRHHDLLSASYNAERIPIVIRILEVETNMKLNSLERKIGLLKIARGRGM